MSLLEGLPPIERKADGQLYRMTPEQFKRAAGIIRSGCCNYMDGACLDLGDICPQLLSRSVCCPWFRWALLEDPVNALLKAQIFQGSEGVKRCEVCGKSFVPKGNRATYCRDCAKKVRKQKDKERKRALRMG